MATLEAVAELRIMMRATTRPLCLAVMLAWTHTALADDERTVPVLVQQAELRYPAAANGAAGQVTVRVTVSTSGYVSDVDVIEGPAVFYEEAIRAGHQLRFQPATRSGEPVEATFIVYFQFTPAQPAAPDRPPAEGELIIEAERPEERDTHAGSVLSEDDIEAAAGQNFAETVADDPSVTTSQGTSDAAKPIIRGQSERRLLLLYDGTRHESQKWGPDHAPEIDPFSAGQIRIVRGAAGARYGPDAIGGVILIEPPQMRVDPGYGGKVLTSAHSNGRRGYAALRLDAAPEQTSHFAYRLEGNVSRGAALSAPDYVLGNTGSALWNLGAAVEYRHRTTEVCLSYQHHDYRAGIFYGTTAASPDEFLAQYEAGRPATADLWTTTYEIDRPYQDVTHDRVLLHSVHTPGTWLVEARYAFQLNRRQEYDQVRSSIEGAQYDFTLRTHSLDLSADHAALLIGEGALEGGLGVQGVFQENVYRGYSLLPNYRSLTGGLFAFERLGFGKVAAVEVGARYDRMRQAAFLGEEDYSRHVDRGTLSASTCEERDSGVARCPVAFQTGSVSVGGLWRPIPDTLELKLDLSSASRFPDADEMYLIGYAPSFPVYALGTPDLGVETTWGASPTVGLRLESVLEAELSGYANYTRDYIYFAPEFADDGTLRFEESILGTWPLYSYTPTDALFTGADGRIVLGPEAPVGLTVQGGLVRATDRSTGAFLIGTPPDRGRATLTARPPETAWVAEPALSVRVDAVARQSRTDPAADYVPAPEGYWLLGAAAEATVRGVRVGVDASNLLNRRYREYTSLLRYYADQPGRDVRVRVGFDF